MADRQVTALALSTVALVPAIYGASLPPLAAVRGHDDDKGHVKAAEHYAATTAAVVVLGIGIATRSAEVIVVGGIAVIAFHLAYTHARVAQV